MLCPLSMLGAEAKGCVGFDCPCWRLSADGSEFCTMVTLVDYLCYRFRPNRLRDRLLIRKINKFNKELAVVDH